MKAGVYIGFATVAGQGPYKAAISVVCRPFRPLCLRSYMHQGWNPFFKNEKKTIEAYLLHEFERCHDFLSVAF
jgi:FAD synthase